MVERTLKSVAEVYNTKRDAILTSIHEKNVSASLSGIEYYPKPWEELDLNDPFDLTIIVNSLTWDGEVHTHTGLRKLSEKEIFLEKNAVSASETEPSLQPE